MLRIEGSNSRSYNGHYKNRKGQPHEARVKVADRFRMAALAGVMVLSFVGTSMVVGGAVKVVIDDKFGDKTRRDAIEKKPAVVQIADTTEYDDLTKGEIDTIITEKPYILKDISNEDYIVNAGDTLGDIAEKCGNTVSRICEINGINKDSTIYPGDNLKLEVITDKEKTDKEIAALESYFMDFIFRSSTVHHNYYSLIYGNSTNKYTDSKSILGQFLNYYNIYHAKSKSSEGIEVNDEVKRNYVDQLLKLTKVVEKGINLSNDHLDVTPYSRYKIYLENGTTEYNIINDQNHTIYK